MGSVDQRIEYWKQRLVDLSRGNRLLYFRPTRTSTLQIVNPAPDGVFEQLVVDQKAAGFWQPPAEESPPPGAPTVPVVDPLTRRPLRPGELLCSEQQDPRLERALRNLQRRAHTEFEERGIRSLHLVCGVLEWTEAKDSEQARSPLMLVPVALERESLWEPFVLSPCEEDPVLNPALQVKLEHDFGVQLPAPPDDWEHGALNEYLQQLEQTVSEHGWHVATEAWVALLSFHKLVMYRDLSEHGEVMTQHPIIRALGGDPEAKDDLRGDPVDPSDLDRRIDPQQSFLIQDADGSQLACLDAVARGNSLVVHGPPGTGKSQTITNIIAQAVGHGQSVLFVSEKMAALDVVRNRLQRGGLGHLVLELHSHKTKKRDVVQELYHCFNERAEGRDGMTEMEFQQLRDRRQQLNAYVHELHAVRQPMATSAFSVLGRLAELQAAPSLAFVHPDAEHLSPSRVDEALQLASRLKAVWHVAVEGYSFPWRGCRLTEYNTNVRDRLERELQQAGEAIQTLQQAAGDTAACLGVPGPVDLAGAHWLCELVQLLEQGPEVEEAWLQADNPELLRTADACLQRHDAFHAGRAVLARRYAPGFFDTPADTAAALAKLRTALSRTRGRRAGRDPALLRSRHRLREWLGGLPEQLSDWQRDAEALAVRLGLPDGAWSVRRLHHLVKIVELLAGPDLPDPAWLRPGARVAAESAVSAWRPAYESQRELREQLEAVYATDRLTEQNLDRLAAAFAGPYRSVTRFLRASFYRDRAALRRCTRSGNLPTNMAEDLATACRWRDVRKKLQEQAEAAQTTLGRMYAGWETDFAAIERALGVAQQLRKLLWSEEVPEAIGAICGGAAEVSAEAGALHTRLAAGVEQWDAATNDLGELLPPERLPASRLPLADTDLGGLQQWATSLGAALNEFCRLIDPILDAKHSDPPATLDALLADLDGLGRLRAIEAEVAAEEQRLRVQFGGRFSGLQTPWEEVISAVTWVGQLQRHFRGEPIPPETRAMAARAGVEVPASSDLAAAIQEAEEALDSVQGEFETDSPLVNGLALAEAPLGDSAHLLAVLQHRIDAVRDWIDYNELRARFDAAGLGGLFAALAAEPPQAADLQRAVHRAVLQAWIDWLFRTVPTLGQFRGTRHESVIAEFRALDERQWQFGHCRVLEEANKRRPQGAAAVPGSEVDTLLREANKSRRHLPLRRLFAAIPNLLLRIKPVLLMSPVTVSQFLSASGLTFDLVVFDEASQIFSEDAVGAVFRGNQIVVCGDQKQLPPTSFFMRSDRDEGDIAVDEDEDLATVSFESILDECMSFNMPSGRLRWHYRSKHESLIAFSNHWIYGDDLVTFAAPSDWGQGLGVRLEYVADGVYERGGRRCNQPEAERVTELVFHHFRTRPETTLGVIALSIAQAEAIQDAINRRRKVQPEFERFFGTDRLDGFFVKNLENVQGDERDDIILSVGYGKDTRGVLTTSFGVLNGASGERRLNVAITRALEHVAVVSSVRAADIAPSDSAGVRLLRHYLDYAERGRAALELGDLQGGDAESPLEESVAGAIRGMGWEVTPQVGCSGYRIDIGVRHPDHPGRFVLGVECDGWTYHSSATARDRDRLRQQVLEARGWRIHRIWSTEWVHRHDHEVERLRQAIDEAREFAASGASLTPRPSDSPQPSVALVGDDPVQPGDESEWQEPYRVADLSLPQSIDGGVLRYDPGGLAPFVRQVVDVEGPVHIAVVIQRLGELCGVRHTGRRIQEAIRDAIEIADGGNEVTRRDDFLWPIGAEEVCRVRVPTQEDPRTKRGAETVPGEEYAIALTRIAARGVGMDRDPLVAQVARVFGFDRTGPRIAEAIDTALQRCLESGLLTDQAGRIAVADTIGASSQPTARH